MKILVVDDNTEFSSTMADIVMSFGYDPQVINQPDEALNFLDRNDTEVGVVLLDIEFGPDAPMNGLDVLEKLRLNYPAIPVVMISGKGTIESAVRATKLGAVNFIEKSLISKDKIKEVLESSAASFRSKKEMDEIHHFLNSQGIIGKSSAISDVGDNIIRFGKTDLNVLITGETGTGKKLVANAIHSISRRAKYGFVTVDIPNIPRELFQSELFGHNKGSFSGANETKKGLFHEANKGTLFLDEIGDLSLELQSNLFLPIEERTIRRVGSVQNEEMDIRFVSATDKDLLQAMKNSQFREQLYHRLRECEIHIPPLSERVDDIPDIVEYYLHNHNEKYNESRLFAPSAIEFMMEQRWSGNVRELASVVRVALQTASNDQIEVSDIHKTLKTSQQSYKQGRDDAIISNSGTLKEDLEKVDMKKIEATLKRCKGNVSKSAATLGISRETLHNKIRKYDINVQYFRMQAKKAKEKS